MGQSFDVVGYDYNADRYCPSCMRDVAGDKCFELDEGLVHVHDNMALEVWANKAGVDRYDESSYDQSEYPKVIFRDQIDEDGERCNKCDGLLD